MKIDLTELKALLGVLEESNVSEFSFEDEDVKLKLRLGAPMIYGAPMIQGAPGSLPPVAGAAEAAAAAAPDEDLLEVTSPFVGTFYRSPSPEAPPFVTVGSVVREGQSLCIIEAMKLMNEIEADFGGTVVEVCGENGKPVEFGQCLFRLKKA